MKKNIKIIKFMKDKISVWNERNKKQNYKSNNLNIYMKFYINYSIKTITFIFAIITLFVLNIIIQSFFLIKPALMEKVNVVSFGNSVILLSPLIATSLFIPMFLSWNLFSRVKKDGIYVFLSTQLKGRKFEFWTKILFIIIVSSLFITATSFFNFFIMIGFRSSLKLIFIMNILPIIACIFLSILFTMVFSIISINLDGLKSIIISFLCLLLFTIPLFISGTLLSSSGNNINWNNNGIKYVNIEKVDKNGKEISSDIGYIYSNAHGDEYKNFGYSNKWGFGIDKIILSPFNLMIDNNISLSSSEMIYLSQKYKNSLVNISLENNGNVSDLGDNLFIYDLKSKNPIKLSFDKEIQIMSEELFSKKFKDKMDIDISSDSNVNLFLERIKKERVWKKINLSNNEKNVIKRIIGALSKDKNLFYLFRDFNLLNMKYKNLFNVLKKGYQTNPWFKVVEYLWTDKNARSNILKSEDIISNYERSIISPNIKIISGIKKASLYNLNEMKNLISFINPVENKVQLLTKGGVGYKWLKIMKDSPFQGISSKKSWDKYIDENSQMINIHNIYNEIKEWLIQQYPNEEIVDINFENNALDAYAINSKTNLVVMHNSFLPCLWFVLLIFLIPILLSISFWTYKRKDIR